MKIDLLNKVTRVPESIYSKLAIDMFQVITYSLDTYLVKRKADLFNPLSEIYNNRPKLTAIKIFLHVNVVAPGQS